MYMFALLANKINPIGISFGILKFLNDYLFLQDNISPIREKIRKEKLKFLREIFFLQEFSISYRKSKF